MLSKENIEFIKRRLVQKFALDKLILFGSQARNDSDLHSDVDLLALTKPNGNRRKLMIEMDRELHGLDYARDIVILSVEEFNRDKEIAGTIARYAHLEGKVLYERSSHTN